MRQSRRNATEAAYLENIEFMHERFVDEKIDYRIVGSLASRALILSRSGSVAPLEFQRPYAVEAVQALPDIDVIVPRADLATARKIRHELGKAAVPVSIGLSASSTEIDFQPDESYSYLIHKDVRIPVPNKLMEPEEVRYKGLTIRTLPIDTHLHTYGTFGGNIRTKDLPVIRGLMSVNDRNREKSMTPFHTYINMQKDKSLTEKTVHSALYIAEKSPALVRNTIKAAGKRVASLKGLR